MAAALEAASPALSVGVISADLMALGDSLAAVEQAGIRFAHFDVMDGCFTPTLTVGPSFVKAVRTRMFKDVHLMIREPLERLAEYVAAGADIVTFHAEACQHPHRVLQALGSMKNANDPARGLLRGVALNPGSALETLAPLVDDLDLIVLLAVNPGWGGQSFIRSTIGRLVRVREMVASAGRRIFIGVDGGITRDSIRLLAASGVDLVVTGSAVFAGDPSENVRALSAALRADPAVPPR